MTGTEVLAYPPDDPAAVRTAAARAQQLAVVMARAGDDLARDALALGNAWFGPAARGCRHEVTGVIALLRSLGEPLHRSGAALRAHAQVLDEARSRIDVLRREYDEVVAVHDAGLPAPVRRLQAEEVQAAHRAELVALHRRHQAELDLVTEHARQTGRQVLGAAAAVLPRQRGRAAPVTDREAELAGRLPLLAAGRQAAGVGSTAPPPGTPPQLVRQWWAALTSDERARAVVTWPGAVGALDGLPAAVRSAANERRLTHDVRMLQGRRDLTDGDVRWLANCLAVRRQLARVRHGVDPVSGTPTTAQLLVFDPEAFGGEGRAAIAVGDLDTADDVAFLVPGLGSEVRDTMAGVTGNAVRVTAAARHVAPGRTTATVAWLGYDAPGWVGAAFEGAADHGADLLAADVLAVQAAREVAPHLTVVAHSYGSTTAGAALRGRETGVDDVVLLGSPGADVDRATDLHVPAGHVFVGASSRDPVSYLDRFGGNPAHRAFGATRFEAEAVTRDSSRLDPDDHSKYFDRGSESLANIARVVTGHYAAVVHAPFRGEVFLLPDGINSDPEADRAPTTVR